MNSRKPRTTAALAKRDRFRKQLDAATLELHEAIVTDLDDGITQQQLVEITGYSRERLRLIAKAARERRTKEDT